MKDKEMKIKIKYIIFYIIKNIIKLYYNNFLLN